MAANNQAMARQWCRQAEVYDEKHRRETDSRCPYRHRAYDWPGVMRNQNLLISDSICKYVSAMHDTRVYAVPGANIDTFINMINSQKLDISTYRIILVHLGTNDTSLATPYRVARNMSALIDVILQWNPWARIAISGILVRYVLTTKEEELRRSTNDEIGYMCRSRFINQMKTWDCVLDKGIPIRGDYAYEGIHLSRRGADKIKHYMEGTIIQLKSLG